MAKEKFARTKPHVNVGMTIRLGGLFQRSGVAWFVDGLA